MWKGFWGIGDGPTTFPQIASSACHPCACLSRKDDGAVDAGGARWLSNQALPA